MIFVCYKLGTAFSFDVIESNELTLKNYVWKDISTKAEDHGGITYDRTLFSLSTPTVIKNGSKRSNRFVRGKKDELGLLNLIETSQEIGK